MDKIRIWAIRAGAAGQADQLFLGHSQIALSSVAIDDDVGALPPVRRAFRDRLTLALEKAQEPTQEEAEAAGIWRPRNANGSEGAPSAQSASMSAGQLYRFVHEIGIGDRILYPRKFDRTLHWGEISGPYLYDCDNSTGFAHQRNVRWIAQASRDEFSPGALFEIGSTLALFRVREFALEFLRRFEPDEAAELQRNDEQFEEQVDATRRDIVETTNDFIAKTLKTNLKGSRLEPLVAELFRAMGYRAHATRAVRDEGVDVIAHRDELGIEPPILKIQVKSGDSNISAETVKAFYAMVQERDVGIFISTGNYTAAAREFARTKGNLKLMAGSEFIGLITKFYDSLPPQVRQLIPMRRVLVPDLMVADP